MDEAGTIRQIGRYRVIDVIGQGGMGVVYRAVDESIDRQVAIKMLRGPAGDQDLLARFYREVRSTANLQHKNIVTVYGLDDLQGIPYMVMEYLEGQSIAEIITSRRPIHLVEKLAIISQVCEGLQYAHQRNVIHRDIKPANILVLKNGTPKIVDFGIARVGRGDTLTRTGQIVGSVYWMSPEQITGALVDCRTDIFSTGVMLFQFLTGELPFKASDGDAQGTFIKILNDPVPSLGKYLSNYPRELDEILSRSMAKQVEERFQSAEEFGDELSVLYDSLRHEMSAEYLLQAQAAVDSREYELARQKLQEVLRVDRRNTQANELFQRLRDLVQRQQKLIQIEHLRSQAQAALDGQQYEEALECVDQACRLDSADSELAAFAASVRIQVDRARTIMEALRRGQAALYAGDLPEAESAVQKALELDQNHTQARALDSLIKKELDERSRRSRLQGWVEQARRDISNRDFLAALRSLREAQSIDPSDSNVQELLNWAVRGHEQDKARQAQQRTIDQIGKLIGETKFSEALELCREAQARYPQDQSLAKLRELAERQLELGERRKKVEDVCSTARRLIDGDRSEQAIVVLEEGLGRFPGEPTLETLLAVGYSERERRNTEREERERQVRALSEDRLTTDSRLRQREEVLGAVSALRTGLTRKIPLSELGEIAARLEQSVKSSGLSSEAEAEVSRTLAEYRSRLARWTKDREDLRQIAGTLAETRNIVAVDSLLDRVRLLALQYEGDETIAVECDAIISAGRQLRIKRDAVAAEAMEQLRVIQSQPQLDSSAAAERQIQELCAAWQADPLIANLLNQTAALVSALRERKEHVLRELAGLVSSLETSQSAGQIRLLQDHGRILSADIDHPEVRAALSALEARGEKKLQELNEGIAELRRILAALERATSLTDIEAYLAAARNLAARSGSVEEITELIATIERTAGGRQKDHARIENSLTQLTENAAKASGRAELDLILARTRDLLKRYGEDRQLAELAVRLETTVKDRRAILAQTATGSLSLEEPVENEIEDTGTGRTETDSSADRDAKTTLDRWPVPSEEIRRGTRRTFYLAFAAVTAVALAAAGIFRSIPRTVVIDSTPSGATLTIDAQTCTSPCVIGLRIGEHALKATRSGFRSVQQSLRIPWFGTPHPLIALTPSAPPPVERRATASPAVNPSSVSSPNAKIAIRTSVPGVSVFVDGSQFPASTTDARGQVQIPATAGKHQIRVEKAGFEISPTQFLTVKPNQVATARFVLKPTSGLALQTVPGPSSQPGTSTGAAGSPAASTSSTAVDTFLIVEAPAGAEIHIDQQLVGHSTGTPLKTKVQPGQRTVDVYLSGFQPYSQSVPVPAGETTTVTAKLNAAPVSAPSTTPAVSHAPNGVSDADRQEIQALLDHYAEGYSQRNIKAIQTYWPSIPVDSLKYIKDFFKMSKTVNMQLHLGNATPAGTRVVITCTQILQFSIDGKDNTRNESKTMYVIKGDSGWLIDYIP